MNTMLNMALASLVLTLPASARGDDADEKAIRFLGKNGARIKRDNKLAGKPIVEVDLLPTK